MLAVTAVSPRVGPPGWSFAQVEPFPGADEDPLYHSEYLKDLYFRANPNYGGRSFLRCRKRVEILLIFK